jgi:hypothetical protein
MRTVTASPSTARATTTSASASSTRRPVAATATNANALAALLGEAPHSTPPATAIADSSGVMPSSLAGRVTQASQAATDTTSEIVITSSRPLTPGG